MVEDARIGEDLLKRLIICERFFRNTKYATKITEAIELFQASKPTELVAVLSELPTEESLMKAICEELERPQSGGKPKVLCRSLRKLIHGEITNRYEELKVLSSLFTHVCIECERGNLEYRLLLVSINEKLSAILFELGKQDSV